ncbi:MAG: carboxypeptidase-like regulatory domain-containing protein, partial [Bacteroidota bacterium]
MPNLDFVETYRLMMRQWRLVLVLWGLSCAFDSSLLAQNSGSTGTLSGKVTDADDKLPLIGVNVVIKGRRLGSSANLDGLYSIARIPAGQYQVEVS